MRRPTTDAVSKRALAAGRLARTLMRPKDCNPYDYERGVERHWWFAGWNDKDNEIRSQWRTVTLGDGPKASRRSPGPS